MLSLGRTARCAGPLAAGALALVMISARSDLALAQGKLEARYTVSLAGIPVGRGAWTIEIADDQYSATASGRTAGVLRVFASGEGSAAARGFVNGGKPVAASYAATIVSEKRKDEVRMALGGGNVKEYTAEPVWRPNPDRVPVTDAHRRGVTDPMTAGLMPVAGRGDLVVPEACNRTLAVFDGRGRYDLALSFKRMERVKADKGYEGPAVVCAVRYHPISGHRPNAGTIKYLVAARDIEIWLAPVAGTRVLVPYRASGPTPLGTAVVEATQFLAASQLGRPEPATANARAQ